MENFNSENSFMKSKDVMKFLGCSAGKLQTLRNNGTIKTTKVGGTLYYSREQVEGLLKL